MTRFARRYEANFAVGKKGQHDSNFASENTAGPKGQTVGIAFAARLKPCPCYKTRFQPRLVTACKALLLQSLPRLCFSAAC